MACLKEDPMKKRISDNNWTLLVYNLYGWNVCEQRLGPRVAERLGCSVCGSVNRLYIKNADQINISANPVEN